MRLSSEIEIALFNALSFKSNEPLNEPLNISYFSSGRFFSHAFAPRLCVCVCDIYGAELFSPVYPRESSLRKKAAIKFPRELILR